MSTKTIVLIFLLFRSIDLLVSFLAPFFIPYLGFFPYREEVLLNSLPRWLAAFANFDGVHYVIIARRGYQEFTQAFFPVYPWLIKQLAPIAGGNGISAGLIISHISTLIGLTMLNKYLLLVFADKKIARWTIIFLLTFPSSFFFGAVYSDSLFFCVFISALYFFEKQTLLPAIVLGALSSATRLMGIFLTLPFTTIALNRKNYKQLLINLSPLIGLSMYMIYLWQTTGDPLFFISAQPAFGANRSTRLIFLPQVIYRYLRIFLTAAHDFQYMISLLEFVILGSVLGVIGLDLWRIHRFESKKPYRLSLLGLHMFSLVNIIIPTLTGTLSSLPRYALLSISFFIALARVEKTWLKVSVALVFGVLHIVLLSYFIQGYFVS